MDKEQQLQADMAMMDEFTPTDEMATETTETEEDGLNYYLNMMATERQAATIEQKMEFIKGLMTM